MSVIARLLLVLLLGAFGYFAHAQSSFFDPSFGSGGKTIVPLGGTEHGSFEAVEIQPDGKVLVAGNMIGRGVIARFRADGVIDSSFATNGFYTYGNFAIFNDVTLQPDGKIVATGADFNFDGILAVRLNSSGVLDASFGAGGIDTIDFGLGNADGFSIAVQADGKIVLAGQVISIKIGLARLRPNGDLDSSFGTNGKVISTYDVAYQLDLAPDGKIVIGGHSSGAHGYVMTVMRFLTDGSVDTSFNHTGVVYTLAGDPGGNFGRALKVQPDGKILLAGSGGYGTDGSNFVVVRYNVNGSLDGSFGSGGIANVDFSGGDDAASGIFLAPDGKIILSGSTALVDNKQVGLACLNSNGSLNSTWGNAGKIVTPWRDISDYGLNLARQADDKIVVVGNSYRSTTSGNYSDPVVARYRPYFTGVPVIEEVDKSVLLYPNPVCVELLIDRAYSSHISRITAVDALGREMDFKIVDSCKVDVSDWANGMYVFTVVSDNGSISLHRIIINN